VTSKAARIARLLTRIARTGLCAFDAAGRIRLLQHHGALDEAAQARLLQRIAQEVLEVHGICVEVVGEPPRQPALVVSNHVSWLDPFVIMAHVPCLPVAKSEVSRWPVVGRIAERSGVHFVCRDNALSKARVVRTVAATLSAGTSVLNFPEGTTTDGTALLPFRPGAFRAARAAGVPVAPLAISYGCEGMAWTGDASFLPHYLGLLARDTCPVRLQFGDLLHARSVTELELARRAHRAVLQGLREVRDGAAVGT
jgi:1-acyl-sn-glycerol-3-phosphate acyltransferase